MSNHKKSLNIGAGKRSHADIDLDISPLDGIDVLGDMHQLPFDDNTFSEVYLEHVLEHSVDVLAVLNEIHRISKEEALVYIRVPHGLTIRGIRDPTHEQYFSLRSIEHFCTDNNLLPSWYFDKRFSLVSAELKTKQPNKMTDGGKLQDVIRRVGYIFNRAVSIVANKEPEVFEPIVSLTSYIDIEWNLKVICKK
ncbi:methyltransferase domain-containing protein [Halosimplex litoreum]|uniref:Methyltransferase domain-containing protein n=1 Tax=Halosimplex litoreum TaxID=1198301 RepID=A0A7T3KVE8_9EURY|nr:methyltransferase domain-containing protein [Halosimplex litoreum]QPV63207.1 methyltransferase domain-containing protein [Halosimplex litoreum]